MKNKVVVIGSLNIDTIQMIDRLPNQGETITVNNQASTFGGKGANQAVAAARQGADVTMIGAVGDDDRGHAFKQLLSDEGISTDYIFTKSQFTGSATIMLEPDGHNTIMVYGGANMNLTSADVEKARNIIANADVIVAQLEVPTEAIVAGFNIAKENGVLTILNPAPITSNLDSNIISSTDLIIPNETEAAALAHTEPTTKQSSLASLTSKLNKVGFSNVVVTLGSDGVYYQVNDSADILPIFKVNAVDTTAAGDTFIGTFSANIDENLSNLPSVIRRSCLASSIAVSRSGAIASIPNKKDVDAGLLANAAMTE
ncbi:ribokinase [Leuconostoc suionicum]|uniref:ribokinase n=1 Tax=Leuconostoc suionicum TaxID=1511761 RepID=UPI001B8CB870|nr:ribokinase [Leuconostoc suionicum]MBS1007904.1 ribokinase [Leuconostoc suionicum]